MVVTWSCCSKPTTWTRSPDLPWCTLTLGYWRPRPEHRGPRESLLDRDCSRPRNRSSSLSGSTSRPIRRARSTARADTFRGVAAKSSELRRAARATRPWWSRCGPCRRGRPFATCSELPSVASPPIKNKQMTFKTSISIFYSKEK